VAVAAALAERAILVLRCDLPFRQARPHGPPRPHEAAADRAGLAQALRAVRALVGGAPVVGGGLSYGGRQASLLAAAEPDVLDGLLLLAYPLHPPGRPDDVRQGHFPDLRVPVVFVHGGRDPFGTVAEIEAARALIPAPAALLTVPGAGHDLGRRAGDLALIDRIVAAVLTAFPAWRTGPPPETPPLA
jgi:predicted alpha/beta-hydrolase family hydrolase